MRFLIILLVLAFVGCAKDTPPPPPGKMGMKHNVTKATQEKLEKVDAKSAVFSDPKEDSIRRVNPFLTIEEERTFGENSREVLANARLSAIFTAAKNAYAIIDGKILKLHDKIYNKEVVEINRNNVILRDASREYIVNLRFQ